MKKDGGDDYGSLPAPPTEDGPAKEGDRAGVRLAILVAAVMMRPISGNANGFASSTPVAEAESEMEASVSLDSHTQPLEEEEEIDAEEQENAKATRLLKGYLKNCQKFYIFSRLLKSEGTGKSRVYTGRAKCMQPFCKNAGVTYTSVSRAHLTRHYQTAHPGQRHELAAALAANSRRGRGQSTASPSKRPQISVEEPSPNKFSQDMAKNIVTRWFVETLCPLSLCEHPYTRQMFAYLSPDFQLMSRTSLEREVDELANKAELQLNNLLYKQAWVATTVDSWSVHSRAFLGMTVHWIDRPSLKRMKATLACRELEVGPTAQLLRGVIRDLHQEFGIFNKVVAGTTDNGANYAAPFNTFGEQQQELQEDHGQVFVAQLCDVQGRLDAEGLDAKISLPPHRRCCVHSLNLMATADMAQVTGWGGGGDTPWRQATAKVRLLWNLQNHSPTAARQIKEVIGEPLTTPVGVRWTSYLSGVNVLLEATSLPEQLEAINNIILHQPGVKARAAFLHQDIKVLTEYRDVMKPVADTLDSLQGEDNAYMGILLPTLLVMKRWLLQEQQRGRLHHAQPLVHSLLTGFDKRFVSLFEDQDLLMASALHPSFTPSILARIAPEQVNAIKGRIVRELKAKLRPREKQRAAKARPDVLSYQDRLFQELFGAEQDGLGQDVDDVDESLRASIQDWEPKQEALSWALFPKEHREAWVDLFLKYNTTLPSSAAVERLFSRGGEILRPKTTALANGSFDKLVFLKGNMALLGYPSYKEEEEKQEGARQEEK